jgi:hypothetical protein
VHSLGGPEKFGASEKLGVLNKSEVQPEERLRAVHRHAERAARELDRERSDSVLHLARAFGAIDRDEVAAQFEARLGFLERQVERLVGRRDQVDRAIQGELQLMRNRVGEAIRTVEAAGEADRRARQALEARMRAALEESEQRSSEAAQALRESLLASWEQTVESERSERRRAQMEALESELAKRAEAARELIGEIRQSFETQVLATVRAAQALTEAAFGGVAERLGGSGADSGAWGPDDRAQRLPAPPTTYQPPVKRSPDVPVVWDVEAG